MFFVYILVSKADGSFYIGQTSNLDQRLKRHNKGLERYTRTKIPWEVLWSGTVDSRAEATGLERKLKNFKSRKRVLKFVENNALK